MEELDVATIKKRSVHGIFAVLSRQVLANIVSFGTSLVIYTQLAKTDIGIYTAVIALHRIVSFFTDLGLGAALIQKKEKLTDEDISTSFTIQLCVTILIFIVIFILRHPLAHFFKFNESGVRLLLALAFTIFLSSFKIIPSILLEREINFGRLAIPQIVESVSFNLLLVVFVLMGMRLDSYTLAFLISGIITIPIYYAVAPWKIRLGFHKDALAHLRYGTQFQIKNILATIKDDMLTVFLVKFISYKQLSDVGFAQENAFSIFHFIVDSVTKVTFSTYSRLQDTKEYLRQTIERSLFYVTACMFPAVGGLIVTAPYIISLIPKWHGKWDTAVFSLIFFSLNAGISCISSILITVLDANGKVKTTLNMMMLWTVLTWTLTPLLIKLMGYNGVAVASFIITLTVGITIHLVRKVVDFSLWKSISKQGVSAIAMSICVFVLEKIFVHNIIMLIVTILIGATIYGGMMYILAREQMKEGLELVKSRRS